MSRENLLGKDWYEICKHELEKEYFNNLSNKLGWLYNNHPNLVLPKKENIFTVFKETRFKDVQLVILGQSPYPSKIHASGRAFATESKYITATVESILYSINSEIMFGTDIRKRCYLDCIHENDYTLQHWVNQGVLLLNSCMTTEVNKPKAHENQGWERFISFIIRSIRDLKNNICFLAWGNQAANLMNPLLKNDLIKVNNNYLYISCEHPINVIHRNRPWNNNQCFKKVNEYRKKNNLELINW